MTQPPLPPWKEPFVSPDGLMTLAWRTYFERLAEFIADHEERIETLEP